MTWVYSEKAHMAKTNPPSQQPSDSMHRYLCALQVMSAKEKEELKQRIAEDISLAAKE